MELKILCVHGVGNHPMGGPWEGEWRRSIEEPLKEIDPAVVPVIEFVHLDEAFNRYKITPIDVIQALGKLAKSGAMSLFRQPKGLGDQIRWTAGMVVQWVENEKLRQETRDIFEKRVKAFQPHIVIGHSLGSLVCYDSFSGGGAELLNGRRFVSCGSQIGNPFVIGNFAAGRLSCFPQAEFWYHLYNRDDDVFTSEIRLSAANYSQVDTPFDIAGYADHDVTHYMRHGGTVSTVWADAVMQLHRMPLSQRSQEPLTKKLPVAARWATKPKKRALLVGVNEYADPSKNLQGCVNDVFLMSSMLQECGFEAEEIRVVLNDRATCASVRERLEWLLDDAKEGDTRFFYYSGHGAQIPTYGIGERVDRVQEALVLHDFDWSKECAFTDEEFYSLYSQLPYEVNFVSVFDCCHSGGMTRTSGRRVRGVEPPDDIRHRMLRWDAKREMWVPREFASPNGEFDEKFNGAPSKSIVPTTHRLGQAMNLRGLQKKEQEKVAQQRGHKGPFMPTLIYASQFDQYAFEYQHGSITHGAFTYSLVKTLRQDRRRRAATLTFKNLIEEVAHELAELGYEQTPTLLAPKAVMDRKIPLFL